MGDLFDELSYFANNGSKREYANKIGREFCLEMRSKNKDVRIEDALRRTNYLTFITNQAKTEKDRERAIKQFLESLDQ